MKLTLNLLATGANTTGFVVPPEAIAQLEGGKTPKIRVTLLGYSYESKIGIMGGKAMIPVSKDVREKSGATAGTDYELDIVLDDAPRVVALPDDLALAIAAANAGAAWEQLAPSQKKAHVTAVEGAKAAETRARRVGKIIETLTTPG
jgi:hypothetical protein